MSYDESIAQSKSMNPETTSLNRSTPLELGLVSEGIRGFHYVRLA